MKPPGDQRDRRTGERILVVDDDADVRKMLRRVFEPRYQVVEAEDGLAAWDILPTFQPAILVTDIEMPGLDGLSLCRKVRAAGFPRLKIIIYTGRPVTADELRSAGADEVVLKTEPLSRLRELVAS